MGWASEGINTFCDFTEVFWCFIELFLRSVQLFGDSVELVAGSAKLFPEAPPFQKAGWWPSDVAATLTTWEPTLTTCQTAHDLLRKHISKVSSAFAQNAQIANS